MKPSTNLIVISGPSGAGKDSVIEKLIERGLPIERIITSTTRKMRVGERQGQPYYFLSNEEMDSLIKSDQMAEWAENYGKKYGVTKKELERVQMLKHKIGIWRIDEEGVKNARDIFPDILTIAITAPLEDLLQRFKGRGDKEEEIKKRIAMGKEFTGQDSLYDYKIENRQGRLDAAADELINILKQEGYI